MLTLTQASDFRSGASLELRTELESAGVDGLIARGNGEWRRRTRQRLLTAYSLPVRGNVAVEQ